MLEQSGGALEATYTSCGSLTLVATFFLGITLKPLWNFKNAMQIVAYLRHLAYMPANVNTWLISLNDAVTFKPVKDYFIEEHLPLTDDPVEKLHQERLSRWGIESESLFWSLGIFAIVFILLFIAFALYGLIYLLRKKFKEFKVVDYYFKKKLFFSSILRYMIESYLKVTHNSIFFLYLNGNFGDSESKNMFAFNITLIVIFVLWPFILYVFLMS